MSSTTRIALALLLVGLPAVGAAQTAPQATPATPLFANMKYVWWGDLVSSDASTITVKVPMKDPVAGYTKDFKAGDKVVLTWSISEKGVADAVLYVAKFEVMQASKVDVGYILPSEFVSADNAAKTLTVKVAIPADAAAAAKSAAGKSIKVTASMSQPKDTAAIASIEASAKPAPKPPPPAPAAPAAAPKG